MIKYINIFFAYLIAPVIGFYLGFFYNDPINTIDRISEANLPSNQLEEMVGKIDQELLKSHNNVKETSDEVKKILDIANDKNKDYEYQKNLIERLTKTSEQQAKKADLVLEQVLSNLLGEPIAIHKGTNSTIKVYTLIEAGYRGYMAKIRPHNSNALKLVLADDKIVSDGETTSEAAKRTGAILAINGGGFWRTQEGKIAPLGITVVDGKIKTFYSSPKLSFVGFNDGGQLIGGKFTSEKEIVDNKILQGSSFVPILLQDGKKVEIPSDWANTKHPRTIVGNFSNGELLFIVIDGRREGWSSGVTLEEVQDKLLSFKVKDAFNLDGGGSSTFYYDGKVLNKPSDGKERPVSSNLIVLP
ncbi:hypothetical protein BHF71_07075 [Vulcanibacillus modesticaldus]|uniref:Phosphodiester glycosidase domain-containing protein n=1 Tax=Vulcanibacillus modesticaldus TaxID=337097 RepID=A0A1D2YWB6_9BACI|nr:phosphodiester glycosidase family protein [Vulcanibacillus modesticaldus]OEF99952.1 hypothetical protein BHF71_07075 [Vulcanibacillus modesticaldus]